MHRLSPIVIVLDNQGYGTERLLHPGEFSFNEIQPWRYHKLPEVLAIADRIVVMRGGRVVAENLTTAEELAQAMVRSAAFQAAGPPASSRRQRDTMSP